MNKLYILDLCWMNTFEGHFANKKMSLVHFMNYRMLKGTKFAVTKDYIAFLVMTCSNYCHHTNAEKQSKSPLGTCKYSQEASA